MPARSLCILYGLNEGPGIGKKFEAACRRAGFTLTRDARNADVIFAHSGGCFLIPPDTHAQKILLVGLPYWPRRLWVVATAKKVALEFKTYRGQRKLGEWAGKWLYHARYFLNLRAAWQMARNQSYKNPWNSKNPQIIIRNREDAYSSFRLLDIHFQGPRVFISLPGQHDDCWVNSEIYVKLMLI